MDVSTAIASAHDVAIRVLAPDASDNDRAGRFSRPAIDALAQAGLLGLVLPRTIGGAGLGPRALAGVVAAIAEVDPSVAMVYLMHVLATATVAAAPPSAAIDRVLVDMASGRHLSTLAFSEAGSRSHFWAPISRAVSLNGASVRITAAKSWVTSAGHADSYVVSSLSPTARTSVDSTLYLVLAGQEGLSVSGAWDGLGLRANASAPIRLDNCVIPAHLRLTEDGAGFQAMLQIVLPLFNLGQAAVALGMCRAVTAATIAHLKNARFEHLGASLGEALPTLRAQLASMQIETDGLAARIEDAVRHVEEPGDLTLLRVLEVKAAGSETAIAVTAAAMRACGGAAFSKQTGIERFFRDAQAGAVMAPTTDVLREFIGKALLGLPLF